MYQNVHLFIGSKTGILNVTIFKYFLHKFRKMTLPKILINVRMTFNYCTQFLQNSQSILIMNISRLTEIQQVFNTSTVAQNTPPKSTPLFLTVSLASLLLRLTYRTQHG